MLEHLASWNPARDIWETDQVDLFSGLPDVYSETWPASGMTRSGRLYALPTSAHPTRGPGCSLLPPPMTTDSKNTGSAPGVLRRNTPPLSATDAYFPRQRSGIREELKRAQEMGSERH